MRAALLGLIIAGLATQPALAGLEDELPIQEGRTALICDIAGILVHEGLLVVRCQQSAPDGVRFFAVERGSRRYEDVRDFALLAQKRGKPAAILYSTEVRQNPGGCKPENCRAILGVELR